MRGFPTKNIPLECFSTLLRFEKDKEFRSLRRATKGSAVGDYLWKLQAFEKA